jgi:cell wall-associated NlpC family hydrolase
LFLTTLLILVLRTVVSTIQATATSTDGIEGAIAWAEQQGASHATDLRGWCQVWVQEAFNAPPPGGAATAWDYFNTLGRPNEGAWPDSVPRGALVFFRPPADGSNPAGHVGISLGGGQMVSVLSAGPEQGVWNTSITYVGAMAGWTMPPSDWPGRPGFAGAAPSESPTPIQGRNPTTSPSSPPAQATPAGTIACQPNSGPVGTTTTVSGSGWIPNHSLQLNIKVGDGGWGGMGLQTDQSGNFSVPFYVRAGPVTFQAEQWTQVNGPPPPTVSSQFVITAS